MKELIKHIETGALDGRITGNEVQIILRALRLLAAAEANDGTTPETDALAKLCSTQFQLTEIARSFERERNGLAARVAELEDNAGRWIVFCHLWAASSEMNVGQTEDGRWAIVQVEPVEEVFAPLIGDTPEAAIDAARRAK